MSRNFATKEQIGKIRTSGFNAKYGPQIPKNKAGDGEGAGSPEGENQAE